MPLLLDLEVKLERCWKDAGGRENIDVVRRKMKSISLPQNGNFWEGKPWSTTTGWLTETLRKQKEWIWPWINTHKYRFLKGVAIHKSLFSAILIFAKIVCSRAAVSGAQVFDRHLLGSSLRVKVTSCCKAKEFEHGLLYAPMHGKCDEF